MEALQVVFVVLKLAGLVDWSWWFVMSPTLAGVGIFVGVVLWAAAKEAYREIEK